MCSIYPEYLEHDKHYHSNNSLDLSLKTAIIQAFWDNRLKHTMSLLPRLNQSPQTNHT